MWTLSWRNIYGVDWSVVASDLGLQCLQVLDVNTEIAHCITKTCLYNFDPLKPHFYIVKLGFTGVYIIFLFLIKNIDYGYSLEPPRRGGSNEYPQSVFWSEVWKNQRFLSENSQFLEVKFSIYLNRRVFVMGSATCIYLWLGLPQSQASWSPIQVLTTVSVA